MRKKPNLVLLYIYKENFANYILAEYYITFNLLKPVIFVRQIMIYINFYNFILFLNKKFFYCIKIVIYVLFQTLDSISVKLFIIYHLDFVLSHT